MKGMNDVWLSSDNGSTFRCVCKAAAWYPRGLFKALLSGGIIYVIGGEGIAGVWI